MKYGNPREFGEALKAGEIYGVDTDKIEVDIHPQGQVYVRVNESSVETALRVIRKAESAGLRPEVDMSDKISIFEKRPECAEEGCYSRQTGGKPYRELCTKHAAERKNEGMRSGATPSRGGRY